MKSRILQFANDTVGVIVVVLLVLLLAFSVGLIRDIAQTTNAFLYHPKSDQLFIASMGISYPTSFSDMIHPFKRVRRDPVYVSYEGTLAARIEEVENILQGGTPSLLDYVDKPKHPWDGLHKVSVIYRSINPVTDEWIDPQRLPLPPQLTPLAQFAKDDRGSVILVDFVVARDPYDYLTEFTGDRGGFEIFQDGLLIKRYAAIYLDNLTALGAFDQDSY